jgi:hypothetical protein
MSSATAESVCATRGESDSARGAGRSVQCPERTHIIGRGRVIGGWSASPRYALSRPRLHELVVAMITRMINMASRQPKKSTMRYRSHVRYLGTMIRQSTTGTVRLYCGVRLSSARIPFPASPGSSCMPHPSRRVGEPGRRARPGGEPHLPAR